MPTKTDELVEYIARQVIERLLTKADKDNVYSKEDIDYILGLIHPELDGNILVLSNVEVIDHKLVLRNNQMDIDPYLVLAENGEFYNIVKNTIMTIQ